MRPAATRAQARALYIVDTDAAVREGLSRLAESAGLEPRPCKDAEEFVQQASQARGACVLIDLSDAGLRKPATLARLSVLASRLPVIALSTRDDLQAQRVARQLGACAFFRKPVDAAALLDSIAWALRTDEKS